MRPEDADWFRNAFEQLVANIEQAVVGKSHTVRLTLTTLLSGGHLLLDDVPGTGKTMLARSLANTVHGTHKRIQFTPDLLPTDITGLNMPDPVTKQLVFHPGPIFATIVLADEINRASPKTQSALLEAMEERQVSVDGQTRPLEAPFMVIATQNPVEQAGTYGLPEAQLDRFMMCTELGYPDRATTVALLADASTRDRASRVRPMIPADAVVDMSRLADTVRIDPNELHYIAMLAEESRRAPEVKLGMSVRGCISFTRAVKTWAAANGRPYVVPDDIKELVGPIMSHRIVLHPEAEFDGSTVRGVLDRIVADLVPPSERAA